MNFFTKEKDIKAALVLSMQAHLRTHLLDLGFYPISPRRTRRFNLKWMRDRGTEIDAIEFQWDAYGRPSFIINFRSFNHPDDLATCRSNPKSINAWDFGCRAYMEPSPFGWFRVRFRDRIFGLDRAISKIVRSAIQRLTEASNFLLGHPPTDFLQDSELWLDDRAKTSPPPWNSGPVGTQYHLPPRRVGEGDKLWSR